MLIGGLQKTSLIDYPGKVAAVIFTAGCNFRCGFCYNRALVTQINLKKMIPLPEILAYLVKRKPVLEAVVITGGEPTLHRDLPALIGQIKKLGYLVKLDTNGTNPAVLQKLIKAKRLDYIAMDIKAPFSKYGSVVAAKVNLNKIKKSIKIIKASGLAYEFRSTVLPRLHSASDLAQMAKMVKGASNYYLQKFRPAQTHNDPSFAAEKSFTDQEMKALAEICRQYVGQCAVRNS